MEIRVPALLLAEVDWVWGMVLFLIFGGGGVIVKVLENMNRTRLEMAQLRAQQQGGEGMQREIHALRDELIQVRTQLQDLKDTTTQYDLSIDTALQRIDRRVQTIESNQQEQQRIGM
jgi:hypothetical protein